MTNIVNIFTYLYGTTLHLNTLFISNTFIYEYFNKSSVSFFLSMTSLADSIKLIPPVTRFFTITSVVVTFLCSIDLCNVQTFYLTVHDFRGIYGDMRLHFKYGTRLSFVKTVFWSLIQCYKFFTCFLVVSITRDQAVGALSSIYFFYKFASQLEGYQGKFRGIFPDCLWFTILTGTFIHIISLVCGLVNPQFIPHYHSMMLSSVTYLWLREQKNTVVLFFGLFPIKAYYLPLFNLVASGMLTGLYGMLNSMIGFAGCYLYQCLQSGTWPVYNLSPRSYSTFMNKMLLIERSKVGTSQRVHTVFNSRDTDVIGPAVFDLGYLKAPAWLYKILKYPGYTFVPESGVHSQKPDIVATSQEKAFQGKGRRLGS